MRCAEFEEFRKAVNEFILPVCVRFGLNSVKTEGTKYKEIVTYENEKVFFSIMMGSPDYEPTISFGEVGNEGKHESLYSLGDIVPENFSCISILGPQEKIKSKIRDGILWISRVMLKYGEPYLLGDELQYRKVKEFHKKNAEIWKISEINRNILASLNAAWDEKDFPRYRAFFIKYIGDIDKINKKRMEFIDKNTK